MRVPKINERELERKLVSKIKSMGGMCPKFVSPGLDGMPDRLVLLPDGKFSFVEVKKPGKVPRKLQLKRHEQLRRLGFKVFVLDDAKQIQPIITATEGGETE
jgi:hypothetical protein